MYVSSRRSDSGKNPRQLPAQRQHIVIGIFIIGDQISAQQNHVRFQRAHIRDQPDIVLSVFAQVQVADQNEADVPAHAIRYHLIKPELVFPLPLVNGMIYNACQQQRQHQQCGECREHISFAMRMLLFRVILHHRQPLLLSHACSSPRYTARVLSVTSSQLKRFTT